MNPFKTLALAAVMSGLVWSPSANAGLIFGVVETMLFGSHHMTRNMESIFRRGSGGFICVFVILPVCLLGDDAEVGTANHNLMDLGYSMDEAKQIRADQGLLMNALVKADARLVVEADDTRETISEQVRSVHPQVSDAYLNFLASELAL